jgi:hypothetical protein
MTNSQQQQQPMVAVDDMLFLALGEQAERQQNAIERGRALYNMREMSRAIQDLSLQNQALTNRVKDLTSQPDATAPTNESAPATAAENKSAKSTAKA